MANRPDAVDQFKDVWEKTNGDYEAALRLVQATWPSTPPMKVEKTKLTVRELTVYALSYDYTDSRDNRAKLTLMYDIDRKERG